MKIRHLFFDLDNTLWDFNRNSADVLRVLYNQFALREQGIPDAEAFIERYHVHNEHAWKAYREGRLDQDTLRWERYWRTLADFGRDNRLLAMEMSRAYLDQLAGKQELMPGARAVLDHVHQHYTLHIITNGFEEVQQQKIRESRLRDYFASITTAESAGAAKPDVRIFEKALESGKAQAAESLYVGDHRSIDGSARNAGLAFVWYNPNGDAPADDPDAIAHLEELPARLDALNGG